MEKKQTNAMERVQKEKDRLNFDFNYLWIQSRPRVFRLLPRCQRKRKARKFSIELHFS